MADARPRFVPALRLHALTPLYDAVIRLTLDEDRFRDELVADVAPRAGQTILDVGCGTASLAIRLARAAPGARVVGIDLDDAVLEIARDKARAAGVEIELVRAAADALPVAPGSVDVAVSSLVFHHLRTEQKLAALRAIHAALRPGGELYLLDWGRPETVISRAGFAVLRVFDGLAPTRDNARGLLLDRIREAGFADARVVRTRATIFGALVLHRARRAV